MSVHRRGIQEPHVLYAASIKLPFRHPAVQPVDDLFHQVDLVVALEDLVPLARVPDEPNRRSGLLHRPEELLPL
jgi:hypothetical protein